MSLQDKARPAARTEYPLGHKIGAAFKAAVFGAGDSHASVDVRRGLELRDAGSRFGQPGVNQNLARGLTARVRITAVGIDGVGTNKQAAQLQRLLRDALSFIFKP